MRATQQDCWLTLGVITMGPLLLLTGNELIEDSLEKKLLALHSLRSVEHLVGMVAIALGIAVSIMTFIGLLASAMLTAARRVGMQRTARLLAPFSPRFMRRAIVMTLSFHLALGSLTGAATAAKATSEDHGDKSVVAPIAQKALHASPAASPAASPGIGPSEFSISLSESPPPGSALFETSDPPPHQEEIMTPLFIPKAPPAVPHPGISQPRVPQEDTSQVTVRTGDTLWGIVADHMGPEATDWEIARAWPIWHEKNINVIGEDPSLLRPGMVLIIPEGNHE